jgi:tetratricopeptide (TPR) repeat protein
MTRKAASRTALLKGGDDIDRLYRKLLLWFYEKQDRKKAVPLAERLDRALKANRENSIRRQECLSLIAEVRGDLSSAIKHRLREIELIRKLHQLSAGKPGERYVLREYSGADLSDRLDLLAILYHDAGKLEQAVEVLEESRRLCEAHHVKFDGVDLLCEYRAEIQQLDRDGAERTGNKQSRAGGKRAS